MITLFCLIIIFSLITYVSLYMLFLFPNSATAFAKNPSFFSKKFFCNIHKVLLIEIMDSKIIGVTIIIPHSFNASKYAS